MTKLNKIILRSSHEIATQTSPQTKTTEQKNTIPMVNESEKDLETPIEGFYVESSTQNSTSQKEITKKVDDSDDYDDDDDIDTSVNPNERIKIAPSIALNKISNQLTNALEQAVDRASNSGVDANDQTDTFFTKAQDLADDKDPNAIFKMDFGKKVNLYGKGIYQYTDHKYNDGDIKIKMGQHTPKIEAGGTIEINEGQTKIIFLGSATRTITRVKMRISGNEEQNNQENNVDNSESSSIDESSEKTSNTLVDNHVEEDSIDDDNEDLNIVEKDTVGEYSAFAAIQHKFSNGDVLTSNGFFNYDGAHEANTTSINVDYYLSKYLAHLTGGTSIYNGEDGIHTNKIHFNCTFNPENYESLNDNKDANNDTNDNNNSNETDKNNKSASSGKSNDHKWKIALSPFFDTDAVAGYPEEGLGVKVRLKKYGHASYVKFNGFGKVSTTQRGNESSLYHLTGGIGAVYNYAIGEKSVIQAKAEIKDKITFKSDQGNILTTTGKLNYYSPKVSAELEGKYISVPNSSYVGFVSRFSYTPKENIHTYAEGSYVNWIYPDGKVKGYSLQLGALLSF